MSSQPSWNKVMPECRGNLAERGKWIRTEASRSGPTPIAIMGAFPTHLQTTMSLYHHPKDGNMWLATECEKTSFQAGSKSGNDMDEYYLCLLGLKRESVCLFDMYPYYLASPGMWRNLQAYAKEIKQVVDVLQKPSPQKLIDLACSEPGNIDRILSILDQCQPGLIFTLSLEVAAFVRRISYADAARAALLYKAPMQMNIFGYSARVVHLAHPNSVSRIETWGKIHSEWCATTGKKLVAGVLGTRK